MPVLETEGRVASRFEAENALVPVMYRQHTLCPDRSHISTPIHATRTFRKGIFPYSGWPALITNCLIHMQIHRAAPNDGTKGYWGASHGFKSGTPGRRPRRPPPRRRYTARG